MSDPQRSRRTPWKVFGILLATLALALGAWMTLPPMPQSTATLPTIAVDGSPLDARQTLPVVADISVDFMLPSTRGSELALADLRGKVVLLNFGFTSCPDICPLTLARMGNVLRELARQGVDITQIQPLFVTVDPERDTLPKMVEYLRHFHPSLIGLRGDAEKTAAVARQYRAIYLRQKTGAANDYTLSHSDFIYLLDQQGRVRLLVGSNDPETALIQAVKSLLPQVRLQPDKYQTRTNGRRTTASR